MVQIWGASNLVDLLYFVAGAMSGGILIAIFMGGLSLNAANRDERRIATLEGALREIAESSSDDLYQKIAREGLAHAA